MKIKKGLEKKYKEYLEINSNSPYAEAVLICVEKVGKNLDLNMDCKKAFWDGIGDLGITGFQSGCIASAISKYHPRGEEFRKWWNIEYQIKDEGEEANKKEGAILNPALLNVNIK